MSVKTNTATAKATPKAKAKGTTIEHTAAIAAYAATRQIDTARAGKLFRARLRANADTYTANGGKAHEKGAPWAAHPRKSLAAIFPNVQAFR